MVLSTLSAHISRTRHAFIPSYHILFLYLTLNIFEVVWAENVHGVHGTITPVTGSGVKNSNVTATEATVAGMVVPVGEGRVSLSERLEEKAKVKEYIRDLLEHLARENKNTADLDIRKDQFGMLNQTKARGPSGLGTRRENRAKSTKQERKEKRKKKKRKKKKAKTKKRKQNEREEEPLYRALSVPNHVTKLDLCREWRPVRRPRNSTEGGGTLVVNYCSRRGEGGGAAAAAAAAAGGGAAGEQEEEYVPDTKVCLKAGDEGPNCKLVRAPECSAHFKDIPSSKYRITVRAQCIGCGWGADMQCDTTLFVYDKVSVDDTLTAEPDDILEPLEVKIEKNASRTQPAAVIESARAEPTHHGLMIGLTLAAVGCGALICLVAILVWKRIRCGKCQSMSDPSHCSAKGHQSLGRSENVTSEYLESDQVEPLMFPPHTGRSGQGERHSTLISGISPDLYRWVNEVKTYPEMDVQSSPCTDELLQGEACGGSQNSVDDIDTPNFKTHSECEKTCGNRSPLSGHYNEERKLEVEKKKKRKYLTEVERKKRMLEEEEMDKIGGLDCILKPNKRPENPQEVPFHLLDMYSNETESVNEEANSCITLSVWSL
ncbi:uncharacterized protein LOC101854008 [Aplysia californica]|uniref:Uncharacterized protein LOC101854008 n=1 Tax=Aplysia californica TaxID=6500 RepID=A0ABM0ZVT9_APLCA|nr:uncharacterized protein LOC101854008 [Aplysia californica]